MNNKFMSFGLFILVALIMIVSIINLTDKVGKEYINVTETLDATGNLLSFDATYEDTLGVGTVRSIEFSTDDGFLAIGISTANKLRIYERDPLIGCYDLLAPQPTTSGIGNVYSVEFSDSSNELVVGHDTSPYIQAYNIVGDTFTVFNDIDLTFDNNVYDLKFYGNDGYLVAGGDFTNYLEVFKYENGDYTKLVGNIDVMPTGRVWDISYNRGYLFVVTEASPFLLVYRQDGDNLVKVTDSVSLPPDMAYSVDVNDRGDIIAVGHKSSPYITLYKFENEVMTIIPVDTIPTQTSITWAIKFVDNSILYTGGDLAVHKFIYDDVNDEFDILTNDLVTFTAPVYVMDHTHDLERIAIGDVSGYDCYTSDAVIVFDDVILQDEPDVIHYVSQRGVEKDYFIADNVLTIINQDYDIDILVNYDYFGGEENIMVGLIPIVAIIVVITGIVFYIKK